MNKLVNSIKLSDDFIAANVAAGYGKEIRALADSLVAMVGAMEDICLWVAYATEEDPKAKAMALQQVGNRARSALKLVDEVG